MKKYYHFFTTVFTYFVFAISIASATVVNIQINTLTFGSEISWDLSDSSGTVLISGSGYGNNNTYDNYINLTDGCYDLNMYDSFGDGWNGGTYNVLDSLTNNIMFTGGITNGSFGSDQICFGSLGCTNPLADNYDSSAIIDNGSCIFSNCNPLTLNLYDSYGDGWNGNDFVMTSSSGVVFFSTTLLNGDTGTAFVCAPDDCYSITCNGGSFQYEISWDLKDSSGGVVMSGGAPFFDSICFPIIYGCTDILANNYDSLANQNDGSCIYPSCLAPAPTLEEFSIGSLPLGYCYPNPSNLWSSSLTFGDGWRFTGNPGYDASSNGRAQGTYAWVDFSGTDVGVVLEMEDIDVSVLDTAHLIFDFFSYSNGSTSPNTMFIEAWDGINWNTIDSLTLDISGWNTYFYDISSQVYNSNTISIRFRCESSGSSTDYYNDLLLDNIKVDNSPIFGCSNILALNYDSTVTIDNGSCLFPSGCTDSLALNYDSSAITNDGSCLYQTGCTNPLADNYDSTAIIDDGSCFFSNCTYLTLNMSDSYGDGWNGNDFSIFDSNGNLVLNSTINNGYSGFENMCLPDDCYSITCNGGSWQNEVSWTLTDTAGLVILSGGAPYSDSICFPIIYGCMNTLADNYDSLANFDNGLCFFGCIDTDTTESFESGQGITWLLDPNNTVDWTNRSGGTPSNSTGPSGAFDGSFYMYTEASFGGDNKDAIMYVPCVDVGAWNQLAFVFAYHMYGSNMGDLTVDISTDSGVTWIEEWTVSGNQGDQWFETIIDLSTYSGSISVRLHAETGNGFRSDIAIDFLRFVEAPVFGCTDNNSLNYNPNATFDNGSCFYGCIDSDTLESFESGQGFTWELDPNNTIDWTNQSGGTPSFNTGPSGAFDGSYYMYTEASSGNSNKEAIMYVSCVDPLGWNQLSFVFAYHMRGTNMGSLTIDISTDSGTTWIQQWTISGNQGNQWNEVQLDLGAYTQNISVRVHAQTGNGYSSDIAIDLLRFEEYPVSGCMDPFASNFDPLATIDDGTCLYTGCTDILAANYCTGCNVTDNSLCIYYLCSGLNFTDNFEGNSLSANGWTTFSGTSASVSLTNVNPIADTVSIEFEGASGGTWSGYQTESDAYANTLHIASISKCIDFTTIGNNDSIALTFETKMYSGFLSEYSWIRVKVDGNVIADNLGNTSYNNLTLPIDTSSDNTLLVYDLTSFAGGNHYVTFESVNKYGAGSGSLNNVWIDNVNFAINLISGCTDTSAVNYNSQAQANDGSCLYTCLNNSIYHSVETDLNPQECSWTISDNLGNILLSFGNYTSAQTIENDSTCLSEGCYILNLYDSAGDGWGAGNFGSVILYDSIGTILANGTLNNGSNSSYGFNVGICNLQNPGCTDSLSSNYNSLADIDNGTCCIDGCMDLASVNYDSLATCDDGSCVPFIFGCTDTLALNYFPGANGDDGSCIYAGCTDTSANNYNPSASIDDGTCSYSQSCVSPKPTGLYAYDIIDSRAKISWDNMNDSSCLVLKYFVRYREVGTNSWTTKSAGVGNGLCVFGLNTVEKQLLNLNPNTLYEFKMKAFYCGGTSSNYSSPVQFSTLDLCPEMTNLSVQVFNNNTTKARFSWDTTGAYVFVRVILRVDTISSQWQTVGGFGVYFPTFSINKFGLTSGESYRAQGRTFCDSNITAYRSPTWTSPIFWTQPGSIRLNGGAIINNLNVYPNPSSHVFNISFQSENLQSLEVSIKDVMGKIIYKEVKESFIGEYVKTIKIKNQSKGLYFLEIKNDLGIINKKIIIQ